MPRVLYRLGHRYVSAIQIRVRVRYDFPARWALYRRETVRANPTTFPSVLQNHLASRTITLHRYHFDQLLVLAILIFDEDKKHFECNFKFIS